MSGGILSFFRSKKTDTANVAAERLQVLVAMERKQANQPDWIPQMQKEIMQVINKYVEISPEDIDIDIKEELDNNLSVLEMNVTLPDRTK